MKTALICIAMLAAFSTSVEAQRATRTKGYVRKSTGTYVAPSYRMAPNKTRTDNYSAKGNVNPYTGKKGTRDPYASKQLPAAKPKARPKR